jgi:uncharacterized integral membrane protein
MRVLYWVAVALAGLALALFAASNREPVALAYWPFGLALELPLYLAILLTFLAGLLCGAVAAWIGGRHWRREVRLRRRSMAALESELTATQAQLAEPGVPVAAPGRPSERVAAAVPVPPPPRGGPTSVAARS